jgi:TRAP-type C4-dicarboxylate transport system permease small subunit
MKHHNHWRYERVTNRMNRRAEAALGYLTALAIGVGLAAVIVYGWQV